MNGKHQVIFLFLTLSSIALVGCSRSRLGASGAPTATAPTAETRQAYKNAFDAWSGGSQSTAEALLAKDVAAYPTDQRLAFFRAACTRSRFEVAEARPLLENVVQLDPNSSMGQCASDILDLDQGKNMSAAAVNINALSAKKPVDPIVLWLNGVECRSYNENEEGVRIYKQLLSVIPQPGPALVHQTYANMLDETGDHREALVHRIIAVREEPAPWSYKGLANTLDRLGRHSDAEKVRSELAARLGQ